MDEILLEKNGKTICWRKLTMKDVEEVERLMKEYCKGDPVVVAVYSIELEETTLEKSREMLAENLSIGAYDLNDKEHLCAIVLISLFDLEAVLSEDLKMAYEYFSTGYSVIFRFGFDTVKDFQEMIRDQKFIFHSYSSTTEKYRNMGITTQLQKKFEAICKEQNCRYVVGVYSSEFTKRATKTLGYKDITEIKYVDYLDPLTNEKPFKDIEFHTSAIGKYFDVES